jgi:hypothetical protein
VAEQGLHADAEVVVFAVYGGPDGGFVAHTGAPDPGDDGLDDVVTEGEQGGDYAGGLRRDVVATGKRQARPGLSTRRLPRSSRRS